MDINVRTARRYKHWGRRRILKLEQAEDMHIGTSGGYEHWDSRGQENGDRRRVRTLGQEEDMNI